MKDYTKKIDSGNGRMKTGPTRPRDYKINPKAIRRLRRTLAKTAWSQESADAEVNRFIRLAKRGIL